MTLAVHPELPRSCRRLPSTPNGTCQGATGVTKAFPRSALGRQQEVLAHLFQPPGTILPSCQVTAW